MSVRQQQTKRSNAMSTIAGTGKPIVYPTSDGQPMAENTKQWRWIVTIAGGLRALFAGRDDVFVAGDLLWYPVEGHPEIRVAPDALVAFGRPPGDRGAYLQWLEGGVAPQVVFEVLSPGNRGGEMARKFQFYQRHGVEEYYIYDPDDNTLVGWQRRDGEFEEILPIEGWVSPRLGVRFGLGPEELELRYPDGRLFASYEQVYAEREAALAQAEQARAQAEQAGARAERLAAKLRALGIDPNGEAS
jgi:Uma2 family endonuclease